MDASAPRKPLGKNLYALAAVSFFTDLATDMIYPLIPVFLTGTLRASAGFVGAIEGAAESTAALLKLASGWWSDRVRSRKPFVLAGYVLATVARPLVGAAQSAGQVLAIRLTDRVGKGLRDAPRDALIADSVDPSVRGRAFGFHRAADHAGAVVGPLVAFALLSYGDVPIRTVFWLSAIPGLIAVAIVAFVVREVRPGGEQAATAAPAAERQELTTEMGAPFWSVLALFLVFSLGNSTDAFLLLRAAELGVPVALAPIVWALLHVVKSVSSTPGGALSDRIGRRPIVIAGWLLYALVYALFAVASATWHAWALFALYGLYFGLTEGTARALIADMAPEGRRGAAFGWYNLVIGLAALPASLLFGALWDRAGSDVAFWFGAVVALVAAMGMGVVRLERG